MVQRPRKINDIIRPHKKPVSTKKNYLVAAILATLVAVSLWIGWQWSQSEIRKVNKDTYQVVSLSNNQLYFGKITNISEDTITLENVYYLVNPTQSSNETNKTPGDTSVLKPLEKSIYDPESTLFLRKDQVISWQNLKTDSQVVKTILER